jgi:hypothetical protein
MADVSPIEEGLGHIEVEIRQLKVQYDMYFSGVIPRQPFELRKDVETMLKTLGNTPMQRFVDRYRYNALASKYQTMVELWNKMIRAKEEGRLRPGIPGFVEPVRRVAGQGPEEPAGAAAGAGATGRSRRHQAPGKEAAGGAPVFRHHPSPDGAADGALRVFYDKFLEASRAQGREPARPVSYEQFVRQIAAKTEAMRRKAGCEAVNYSIMVRDGGVTLKATPSKGRNQT